MGAAPAFARQDLDRLIALGLRKGELTPADLQAALPIHAMSAEDIARVVLELEEAGVPVELEDLIGGLAHPGGVAPLPIAPEPGLPGGGGTTPDGRTDAPRGSTSALAPPPTPESAPSGGRRRVSLSVLVAGLIVLGILMGALLVLGQ